MSDNAQWHRRVIAFPTKDDNNGGPGTPVQCYSYDSILEDLSCPSVTFYVPTNRNFLSYATTFEKNFSTMGGSQRIASPVISGPKLTRMGEVKDMVGLREGKDFNERDIVAHVGDFYSDNIYIPKSAISSDFSLTRLKQILLTDSAWIAEKPPEGFYPFGSREGGSIRVVTCIDGKILWCSGGGAGVGGAEHGFWINQKSKIFIVPVKMLLKEGVSIVLSLL